MEVESKRNNAKAALLIVDDEPRVLDVLVKTFESQYVVWPCLNAMEALEVLAVHDVQVILTDERMPKMGGMTFLKQARERNPSTVNIILTAYSDITVAIEAINSGIVYRYIVKPWDTEELMVIVRQAFERHHLFEHNRVLAETLVSKNKELEERLEELERTREKLSRSEKLSLIGQLTASIGHELKNPLSRIKSAANIIKTDMTDASDEKKELLKIIDNEVLISTKIINDLLDFSRDRKASLKFSDLNQIIESTLSRLRIPQHIVLEQDLEHNLTGLYLDDGQIQQVLINLIMNSIQALDDGGKIYLKTERTGTGVQMTVKDTGCGIRPEHIEKIFEPLYTTKPKGIGLGMSIVKMLMDKHEGTIEIDSRENVGTTVILNFPLVPSSVRN